MNNDIAQSVARNTTIMMGSQIITWASSFALMLFLPRYLGSEEYGRLFLAISVTWIIQIFIEFGGNYYIVKEISRSPEAAPGLLSNSIALRVILWVVSLAAMAVFTTFIGYSMDVKALLLVLGISKLWEGSGRVLCNCYQGLQLMQFPSAGAIVERVFVTTAGITALILGVGPLAIAIIMGVSTLLNFLVLTRFTSFITRLRARPQWAEMGRILHASIPYFLWATFSVVYYRVDAVMLSIMVPESVVGWYGAAYRFFDVLMFLPSIYSVAIFPVLSKLWTRGREGIGVTTQKSLEFIFLAGVPVAIAVFLFSEDIIGFLFGSEGFSDSAVILRILSCGLILVYIDSVLGTALFASDRQRYWTATAFFAMLLNPLLNYYLIPYTQMRCGNGGIGAALATLITEFFVMVMAMSVLPRSLFETARPSVLLKGVAAGALMMVTTWQLEGSVLPWMFRALAGFGVYCAAIGVLRTVEPVEREFIKRFFSYRNLKTLFAISKETS